MGLKFSFPYVDDQSDVSKSRFIFKNRSLEY